MARKKFNPETGKVYENQGGGEYRCIWGSSVLCTAIMQNTKSKWTLTAHGCGIYDNGKIDWDYSTDGYFA